MFEVNNFNMDELLDKIFNDNSTFKTIEIPTRFKLDNDDLERIKHEVRNIAVNQNEKVPLSAILRAVSDELGNESDRVRSYEKENAKKAYKESMLKIRTRNKFKAFLDTLSENELEELSRIICEMGNED